MVKKSKFPLGPIGIIGLIFIIAGAALWALSKSKPSASMTPQTVFTQLPQHPSPATLKNLNGGSAGCGCSAKRPSINPLPI